MEGQREGEERIKEEEERNRRERDRSERGDVLTRGIAEIDGAASATRSHSGDVGSGEGDQRREGEHEGNKVLHACSRTVMEYCSGRNIFICSKKEKMKQIQ